jgi:polysaccharide biosynthesis PFTS motif protein
MRDRVTARTGIDMRIVLKHKRPPTWQHDRQYFDHIDKLVASARRFEVTPADSNVYGLIADSRLVIAPPYSSPAYVAAHVGVPAIFYDPTGQVLPTHAPHPLIRFADGQEALEAVITELANRDTPATVRS